MKQLLVVAVTQDGKPRGSFGRFVPLMRAALEFHRFRYAIPKQTTQPNVSAVMFFPRKGAIR